MTRGFPPTFHQISLSRIKRIRKRWISSKVYKPASRARLLIEIGVSLTNENVRQRANSNLYDELSIWKSDLRTTSQFENLQPELNRNSSRPASGCGKIPSRVHFPLILVLSLEIAENRFNLKAFPARKFEG